MSGLISPILEQAGFVKSALVSVIKYVYRLNGFSQHSLLSSPLIAGDNDDFTLKIKADRGSRTAGCFLVTSMVGDEYGINIYSTGDYSIGEGKISVFRLVNSPVVEGLSSSTDLDIEVSRLSGVWTITVNGVSDTRTPTSEPPAIATSTDSNLGRRVSGGFYYDGYISNLEYYLNGTLTNSIPLTNKAQGATQLPTVGNVSATIVGYDENDWEEVEPVIDYFSSRYNLILNNGQSLSIGDKGFPLTHDEPTFSNRVQMFNGASPIGAGFEIGIVDDDLSSLVDFKEKSRETHSWSMLNWIDSSFRLNNIIYSSTGVGGKTISELTDIIPQQVWGWENTRKVVDKVKALGDFNIPFTTWIHGEADSVDLDPAQYKTDLREYHDRLKSLSGKDPFMAIDQTGKLASLDIASTLLDYSEENEDCVMSGPKYWLNRLYPEVGDPSIRLHLNADGYMLQGEMLGECIKQRLSGVDFKPLSPKKISVLPDTNYRQVRIDFNVPSNGNIVIDSDTLPPCPGLGLELKYLEQYSTVSAVSYELDGNSIVFTFDEPITSEATLMLGDTLDDRADTDNVKLPCTNIRSNVAHNSKAISGFVWYDWACQFKRGADDALDRQVDNLWLNGDFSGDIEPSQIVLGGNPEWLLIGLGDVTVSCDVNAVSGTAWLWVHNTRVILSQGYNEVVVPTSSTNRMYLQGSSSGFSGSVTNIDIRSV